MATGEFDYRNITDKNIHDPKQLLERLLDDIEHKTDDAREQSGLIPKLARDMDKVKANVAAFAAAFQNATSAISEAKQLDSSIPSLSGKETLPELVTLQKDAIKKLKNVMTSDLALMKAQMELQALMLQVPIIKTKAQLIDEFFMGIPLRTRRRMKHIRLRYIALRAAWSVVALLIAIALQYTLAALVNWALKQTIPTYAQILGIVIMFYLQQLLITPRTNRWQKNTYWALYDSLVSRFVEMEEELLSLKDRLDQADAAEA